jgi:hypothetical protein
MSQDIHAESNRLISRYVAKKNEFTLEVIADALEFYFHSEQHLYPANVIWEVRNKVIDSLNNSKVS